MSSRSPAPSFAPAHVPAPGVPSPWSSLRRKLPLLITALVGGVVAAVCLLAYRQVEGVLLAATGARLAQVTQQLADMLDASAIRVRRELRALAADPTVQAALRRPSPASRRAAARFLEEASAQTPQVVAFVLAGRDGAAVATAGSPPAAGDVPEALGNPADAGAGAVSVVVRDGAGLRFRVVVPVVGAAGDTLGVLVAHRRVAGQGAAEVAALIGSQAALLVGNARGDVWTDLARAVPGPPPGFPTGRLGTFTAADGEPHVGVAVPIRATPWVVLVHLPRAAALAPARLFVLRIAAVGGLLVALGAVGAWLLSRQVTTPLGEVTRAAGDVARGDYARRVAIRRRDELGSLATSFNSMATQVQAAALALEAHAAELETANEALRNSEARYRGLLEAAHEGICAVDEAGRITYANQRLAQLLGATRETLRGRTIFEYMEAEDAAGARGRFARRARDTAETRDVRLRRRDGATFWATKSVSPLRDAEGRRAGALFILSDSTERHEAQERLARSERHFRALIEHASEGIALLDGDGTVRYVSPAFERSVGARGAVADRAAADATAPRDAEGTAAIVGTPYRDRVHPEDLATLDAARAAALAEPARPAQVQYRYRHTDGRWRTLSAVVTNLLADPAVAGIVVNARDVTAERALGAQLLQAQRMEAVGQLAAGVAHDFNNLLTVITSYTAMLLDDAPDGSPARADLEEVRRAAERAGGLTRQLLAFSRQQVLEPRVLDLNAVVRNVEKMLRRVLGEDVRLETALAADLGPVYADAGQLEQVIVNLAVNARDAMPNGGALTIETADVELDAAYAGQHAGVAPGAYVRLAVSDTGVGMDAETRARVFEPFFTTKEVGKGTGLGLATVYGIVTQSGGHAAVYSEPGVGTAVKVYLPRDRSAGGAPAPERDQLVLHEGAGTVLLVEDEGAVRAAARRILERAGYTVLEAANGAAGLRACAEHGAEIDLLLTDLVMPDMNGRELASQFAAQWPETPTAFMSGYTEDAVQRQRAFAPGTVFIQKPFTPGRLTAKVREALARAPAARTT